MNIGKVFREAREDRGLTLRAMSSRLGLSPSALWKIEAGKNWPKQKTIEALRKETGRSMASIYIESIEPEDFLY